MLTASQYVRVGGMLPSVSVPIWQIPTLSHPFSAIPSILKAGEINLGSQVWGLKHFPPPIFTSSQCII